PPPPGSVPRRVILWRHATAKVAETVGKREHEITGQSVAPIIKGITIGNHPRHIGLFVQQVECLETNGSITSLEKLLFDIRIDDQGIRVYATAIAVIAGLGQIDAVNPRGRQVYRAEQRQIPSVDVTVEP